MKTGITLITMGAGNVKALKKTLDSFAPVCDEVIYGDMLLFEEDRRTLFQYKNQYDLSVVKMPFDDLFKHGFSYVLNQLAYYSRNDIVIYSNTSEIIEEDYGILDIIKNNPDCNSFFFIHKTDPHRWFRCYNRQELKWDGRIHESLVGEHRPYHKPIYMMADLEKDMDNSFKAKVFNDVKEIVYFRNYRAIIEDPNCLGGTDPGWIRFAEENYDSMGERLLAKGKRYEAFLEGYLDKYIIDLYCNPEFEKERFESSHMIEFQGDPKFLNK